MVKDYELLKNAHSILDKELIIWGAGVSGREIFLKLQKCGANVAAFIDADISKQGSYLGRSVYGLETVCRYMKKENVAFILSPVSVSVQKEILTQISSYGWQDDMVIYTKYAVEFTMCVLKVETHEETERGALADQIEAQNKIIRNMENRLRFMERIFRAEMSKEVVFIYQSKKVASRAIAESALDAGIYGVHTHKLTGRDLTGKDIREFISEKQGKVISLVRDPVARQVSLMWHYLNDNYEAYIHKYGGFENIEKAFFSLPNKEDEFEWYKKEMEVVLGIDIYEYPFDRNLGYSVIEKDGISLLLIKVERLSSLEQVIADFLQNSRFKLWRSNTTEEKICGQTYKNYLCNADIPEKFLDFYYEGNEYMDHFYTEQEKKTFYNHWRKKGNKKVYESV